MSQVDASSSGGPIPLLQYAAVVAALDDGFELAEVLSVEGIGAATWEEAEHHFKRRLAVDRAEMARYAELLAQSQDRLIRSIEPLDSDLASWMGFLDQFGKEADPLRMVERLGLRPPDLARLRRRWDARFEQAAIRDEAARIAEENARVFPTAIKAGESRLLPSGGERVDGPAPRANAPDAGGSAAPDGAAGPASGPVVSFGLHQLAMLTAELDAGIDPEPRIFERHGLGSPRSQAWVLDSWRRKIDESPELRQDFEMLRAHAAQRLSLRAPGDAPRPSSQVAPRSSTEEARPPAEQPAAGPPKHLVSTAPVARKAKPKTMPFAAPVITTPKVVARAGAAARVELRGPSDGTGTAPAFKAPLPEATPFAKSRASAPSSTPQPLASTAPLGRPRIGPTMPFRAGEGRGVPPPSQPAPASERMRSTAPARKAPKPPTMPFATPPGAKPNKLAESSLNLEIPRHLFAKPASSRPAPEAAPAHHPPFVALTLEQYASLQVELDVVPQEATSTLLRYRLTPASKQHVDDEWRRAMDHNPALRAAWVRAYETYRQWFIAQRR